MKKFFTFRLFVLAAATLALGAVSGIVAQATQATMEAPPGDGPALAKAGEFHLGSDPTVWILIVLFNLALAVSLAIMLAVSFESWKPLMDLYSG